MTDGLHANSVGPDQIFQAFSDPKSLIIDLIGGLLTSPNMVLQPEKTRVTDQTALTGLRSSNICHFTFIF